MRGALHVLVAVAAGCGSAGTGAISDAAGAPAPAAVAAAEAPSMRLAASDEADLDAGADDGPGVLDDAGHRAAAAVLPGRWIDVGAARPQTGRQKPACAVRRPLCVHASARARPADVLATLAAAERAWEALEGPLAFPPPDPDPVTRAFDIYLAELDDDVTETHFGARDPRGGMDRASAFAIIDPRVGHGCALDAAVARAIARGALFRVAPATDEASALAQTAYLARLLAPCATGFDDGIAQFQARPEGSPFDTHPELPRRVARATMRGAALVPWWIDASFGAAPGAVVRGLWALAPSRTPLGGDRWVNEPDGFDVLRASFKGTLSMGSTVDDLFLGFGVARAFAGAHGEGLEAPETQPFGGESSVRLDWDVPWPDKPRRLASSVPVAPFGSAYVRVRGVPKGARLRVEVSWEQHAAMRWTAVKLDAAGKKLAQIPLTSLPRATETQRTLADLEGVDAVLLVGVNVGDPSYEFDPDDIVWEPHAFLVTLAAE